MKIVELNQMDATLKKNNKKFTVTEFEGATTEFEGATTEFEGATTEFEGGQLPVLRMEIVVFFV